MDLPRIIRIAFWPQEAAEYGMPEIKMPGPGCIVGQGVEAGRLFVDVSADWLPEVKVGEEPLRIQWREASQLLQQYYDQHMGLAE